MILVRHALAESEGWFAGQLDFALTAHGRSQLPDLVRQLSGFPITAAYASDLTRAKSTAEAIAGEFHIPLECRPGLREMNFGEWQGLSWREIEQKFPATARNWLEHFPEGRVPGGEGFPAFKDRVSGELEWIASKNRGRCVVVVTHAGVIRIALASASGIPEREIFRDPLPHCAIRTVEFSERDAHLRCVNA